MVAWAAHGITSAALSAFLALKARATGEETELLAAALRVSGAHERLQDEEKKKSKHQQNNVNIT